MRSAGADVVLNVQLRTLSEWTPMRAVTTAVLFLPLLGCSGAPPVPIDDIFLLPSAEIRKTPADQGFRYDELFVPIDESRKVSIWHVHAEDSKGIVVIVPGSDSNKAR